HAAALLTAAVRAPHVLARRDLRHRPAGGDAGRALVDERVAMLGIRIFVGDLLEHPRLAALALAGVEPEQHPFSLHALALEREVEMAFLDRLARVLVRMR